MGPLHEEVCILLTIKAIPVHDWTGPQSSRRLKLPVFLDNQHTKVQEITAYTHYWYRLSQPQGGSAAIYDNNSLNCSQNEKCFRQICRENQNTHFTFKNFVSTKCAIYQIMWKNMVEVDRPQMTIQCGTCAVYTR